MILYRHPAIHAEPGAAPVTGVLVRNGVVVAAGDAASLAQEVGIARTVELPGVCVIPGLHDAHIHTAGVAEAMSTCDLRGTRSLDEALARVKAHAERSPTGWVTGGRYDANTWSGSRPHRDALDHVLGDRPAVLNTVDGHSGWVNSAALLALGITDETPDPDGGEFDRDHTGRMTGIVRENALELFWDYLDERSSWEDLVPALDATQRHFHSLGITSVTDFDGEDCRAAYARLHERGDLRLRVHKGVPMAALDTALEEGRRTGDGDAWLSTGLLKLFSDGALGSHTCHMTHPFVGEPDNTGIAVTSYESLLDHAARAVAAGIGVGTHAIGDRANQIVLDVYDELRRRGEVDAILRVEHAQYLVPGDQERMARLGVVASMQPTHCTTDIPLTDRMLAGHDVMAYAWRSLLDAGALVAFGSDAPVEPTNPFFTLHAAVTRQQDGGVPPGGWQPHERVTPAEAVLAHTHAPSAAVGWGDRKGLLRPGYLADFVALDTDVMTAPTRETQCLATVVDGEVVWSA